MQVHSNFSTFPLVKEADFCARLRVPDVLLFARFSGNLPCEFVKSAWQCLLHLSVQADVLDTLSLRDHLITDFLLSTVIL